MIKKILKSSLGIAIIAFIASSYIRFVWLTSRWKYINYAAPESLVKEGKPFIVAFFHGRLLMLPFCWRLVQKKHKKPFYMLISAHKDGRLISRTVGFLGIKNIAGSTNKGGKEALVKIIKFIKKGEVIGFTPDGPRGPGESISDGTIRTAQMAGVPILPVTYSTSRHKLLKTWDKFFIALPFSKGVFSWGDPVDVSDRNIPLEQHKTNLQTAMLDLKKKADDISQGRL
tara:strand:- start:28034 stop:28717 length:684 start_codon:yes stop_codon:yes gene_type:complete